MAKAHAYIRGTGVAAHEEMAAYVDGTAMTSCLSQHVNLYQGKWAQLWTEQHAQPAPEATYPVTVESSADGIQALSKLYKAYLKALRLSFRKLWELRTVQQHTMR